MGLSGCPAVVSCKGLDGLGGLLLQLTGHKQQQWQQLWLVH
jgi:hypothetical protein